MPDQAVLELIEYLEKVNAEVKRIEAEGDAVLGSSGQDAFRAKLEEKAELLAGLAEDSLELVERVDGGLGDEIAQRMERFSTSASTALRVGSVFFMTALLYPEDHRPGEPNDLEVFIGELRGA